MLKILPAILFFGCSCQNNKVELYGRQCKVPVKVFVAENTSPEFSRQISEAVRYWNSALDHEMFLNSGTFGESTSYSFGSVYISVVPDLQKTSDNVERQARPCGRMFPHIDGDCISAAVILINKSCPVSTNMFQTIIRHELGHTLGLVDVDGGNSLMNWKVNVLEIHPANANEVEIKTLKRKYRLE